jgi:hypothetical protein
MGKPEDTQSSDVRWKIFRNIFQKNFRFLKSSLNISLFLTRVDMSHAHDTA